LTEAGVSALAAIIAAAIMRSQGVNVTGFAPPASSEIAASGGAIVLPTASSVRSRFISGAGSEVIYVGETLVLMRSILESDGVTPVDMTGEDLVVIFEDESGADVAIVTQEAIAIGGEGNNTLSFNVPSSASDSARLLDLTIRRASSDKYVFHRGHIDVRHAAQADS
jgi:hypothetical protein